MKRNLKTLLIAMSLFGATAMISCNDSDDEPVKVTGIEITSTPDPLTLTVGGATGKVEASVVPSNASDKSIAWSVSPAGVVEVAADGTVTAIAPGPAVITATAAGNVIETCNVTVAAEAVVTSAIYTGTVSVAPGTPDAFTLEDVEVEFTLGQDETTADIEMLQVKFAIAMLIMLDMLMSGVTLTETNDGYAISGEGIIPTVMGGRPFEQYTINDLSGSVTPETLSIDMMCGTYPLSFEGTVNAE